MNASRVLLPVCVALLLVVGCGKVKEKLDARTKEKKQAATPSEAVEFYLEACKNKDVDALLRQLHPTVRKAASAKHNPYTNRALKEYEDALDAKFGKQPAKAPSSPPVTWDHFAVAHEVYFLALSNLELVSEEKKDDDLAVLKCKATPYIPKDEKPRPGQEPHELSWLAIRVPAEGADTRGVHLPKIWKLVPPFWGDKGLVDANLEKWEAYLKDPHVQKMLAEEQREADRYARQTKLVKAGKYKDRKHAETAFAIALAPTYAGDLGPFDEGTTRYFRVTGKTTGSFLGVLGSSPYGWRSDLSEAAVHAGVLKAGQSAVVKVTAVKVTAEKDRGAYPGSTRNGVTSQHLGTFLRPAGQSYHEAYTVTAAEK